MSKEAADKEILIYLVEQRRDKRLLALYRVLTSKFRVLQSHSLKRCFEIEFMRNDKMNHIADRWTVNEQCFNKSEYRINGQNADQYTKSWANGVVHRIECRNVKLFGYQNVCSACWIQWIQFGLG